MKKLLAVLVVAAMGTAAAAALTGTVEAEPTRVRRESRQVDPLTAGNLYVACPRGFQPSGGGFNFTRGASEEFRVTWSEAALRGWWVGYEFDDGIVGVDEPVRLSVSVVCIPR